MDIALINGKSFDFDNYDYIQFDIGYISDQLANIRRFNGNGESTLNHSIAVANALEHMDCSIEFQLVGLLYDAPEVITGNINAPLKRVESLKEPIEQLEYKLLCKIINDLGITLSQDLSYYLYRVKEAKEYVTKLEILNLLRERKFKATDELFAVFGDFDRISVPLKVAYYNYYLNVSYTSISYFQLFNQLMDELKGKNNE